MRVICELDHVLLDGEWGQVEGVEATCGRCGYSTESFGTSEASVNRCLVLMRKECPGEEGNFYVADGDEFNTRPQLRGSDPECVSEKVRCTVGWNQKATKAAKGDGSDFPKAPPGNHPAVLVALIDMGTQTVDGYQGGPSKEQHRAFMLWELVSEPIDSNSNHLIGLDLNVSLNEKAKLRKWIEARTGKPIAEGTEYDISQELGKPCLLNVVEKNGYPRVEGMSGAPKGMTFAKHKRGLFSWTLEDFDKEGKVDLPDWIPYLFGEPLTDCILRCAEIKEAGRVSSPKPQAATSAAPAGVSATAGAAPATSGDAPPPRRKGSSTTTGESLYWFVANEEAVPVKVPLSTIKEWWEGGKLNASTAEVCPDGKEDYLPIPEAIPASATWVPF